jgi:hypothetical protein
MSLAFFNSTLDAPLLTCVKLYSNIDGTSDSRKRHWLELQVKGLRNNSKTVRRINSSLWLPSSQCCCDAGLRCRLAAAPRDGGTMRREVSSVECM